MMTFDDLLQKNGFVRETEEDLLYIIKQTNCSAIDVIRKIIGRKTTTTDLFCLSVYLFGFVPVNRVCPFYFYCKDLYQIPINYKDEEYTFTYKYDPIENGNDVNPCHFIFQTMDQNGVCLPRDAKTNSEKKHNKALAIFILESILGEAACFDCNKLEKWNGSKNILLTQCQQLFDCRANISK